MVYSTAVIERYLPLHTKRDSDWLLKKITDM